MMATYIGKPCSRCGGTLRYRCNYTCVACVKRHRQQYMSTPGGRSAAKLRNRRCWLKKYGLTPGDFDRILASQGGRCAACGLDDPGTTHGWHVDHDHDSGRVRGILCHGCNSGIGLFDESIERLMGAVEYLIRNQATFGGWGAAASVVARRSQ